MTLRPLATALLVATLAAALTPAGAVFDMPDDGVQMTGLGKVGRWEINKANAEAGGALVWCEVLTSTTIGVRYEHGPKTRALGFSAYASASTMQPFAVELWWDGDRAHSATLEMTSEHGNGYLWRTYRVPVDQADGVLDNLRTAKTLHVAYKVPGEADHVKEFTLDGAAAAMDKAIACAN